MSDATPTLSGVPIKHAELHVPATGLWHLDVALQDATDPGTAQRTFIYQSFSGVCTPLRSINFAGERGIRLVAGNGGWRKTIPPRQYASPTQIMLSTIVLDAAAAAGEPVPVISSDLNVGTGYVRTQGPASRALDLLPAWWADFTGTVQSTARSTAQITSDFTLLDVDRPAGKYVIATEAIGDWTPGRTFQTPTLSGTISRVYHEFTSTQVRTYVFSPVLAAGQVLS